MWRSLLRTGLSFVLVCWPAVTEPLTLKQAVEIAGRDYPAVRASLARVDSAASGVDLAKTAYLPRADLYYQLNLASRNNIFGLTFPNRYIPGISGPALDEQTATGTFGSAAGLLFSWEPFDFGLRQANVAVAEAVRRRARAGVEVTRYEISLAVAETYLRAIASQQAVAAARANVERMEVFNRMVKALADAELRPGADQSRARAELARARTELLAAERSEREARTELAGWLGRGGQIVEVEGAGLLTDPPAQTGESADLSAHPVAAHRNAGIEVARAKRDSISKEYRPKFTVLSSAYGRGTGARLDGTFQGGANGMVPSVGNWAVGLGVEFAVMDYKANKQRREIATHDERTEQARLDEVLQNLKTRLARAQVQVETARKIAAQTPVELEAARTLDVQAQARYKAGLGTVVEVADAQRLLRQAETDEALARLGVWQALFTQAAAEGDMDELLAQASR